MSNPIYNITPFTLLDYPEKVACIIWFAGCNMRCLYCYNPEIILGKGTISVLEVIQFLESRKHLLQAVVFSGGECTSHPEVLSLARAAKAMGYLIKIDTNGTHPTRMKQLIDENLIDYIALDFKGLDKRFKFITQSNTFAAFEQTLALLQNQKVLYEVRTTYHSDLLSTIDLKNMVQFLTDSGYIGNYYIQSFLTSATSLYPLGQHMPLPNLENLSTATIQIVLRN